MDENRKLPRQRTLKGGKIVINDGFSTYSCTVRNLTTEGAKLIIASIVGIPDHFTLVLDDGRKFSCDVIWRKASELGVQFSAS